MAILNRLTGRSTLTTGKCPAVTANSIAAQLVQNGRFPNHDRGFSRQVLKEYTSLWRAQRVVTGLARDCSYEELTIAFKHLRHGKATGPDNIHAQCSCYTPVIMPKNGYECSSTNAYTRVSYQGYCDWLLAKTEKL